MQTALHSTVTPNAVLYELYDYFMQSIPCTMLLLLLFIFN